MRYMLLICGGGEAEETAPVDAPVTDERAIDDDALDWVGATAARRTGHRLRPPAEAVTVRVRGGEVLRSDGPFAETKEFVAGYDLLDCDTLDEAVEAAARHPVAAGGAVEIRPYWDDVSDEDAVRAVEEDLVRATRERDADRMAVHFDADIERYDATDLTGVRAVTGADAAREQEEEFFAAFSGPLDVRTAGQRLLVGEGLAFSHGIHHVTGTLTTGEAYDAAVRVTTGYRLDRGRWLVVHRHLSVAGKG
ncbi:YciI family protein [Streptomyces sp. NPDC051940]|uniref:YciI family protein n=1 Tax=Streptomyces sp. NPDC051940 TaxID=3155675 RepID=UPI00343EE1F6